MSEDINIPDPTSDEMRRVIWEEEGTPNKALVGIEILNKHSDFILKILEEGVPGLKGSPQEILQRWRKDLTSVDAQKIQSALDELWKAARVKYAQEKAKRKQEGVV